MTTEQVRERKAKRRTPDAAARWDNFLAHLAAALAAEVRRRQCDQAGRSPDHLARPRTEAH